MTSFSFIHTADLHLDSAFSTLGKASPETASIMRSATFDTYDNIISLCIEKEVDFLLVAGDVYDGADKSLRAQVRFRDGLKRLHDAGIASYIVHGNHDPLNVWSSTLEWPSSTHIFKDRHENIEIIRGGDLLACIQGISYPFKEERRNLSLLFKRTSNIFQIGLLHANVGSDTGHEPYAPCSMDDLRKSEMDFWALGHVHERKVLQNGMPFILYPGNVQGRNIRETGPKGCYMVRVDDNREVEETFHETAVIPWVLKEVLTDNFRSEQELINALNSTCLDISEGAAGRQSITRIILKGSGPLSNILLTPNSGSDLLEMVRDMGASCSPSVWVEQLRLKLGSERDLSHITDKQDFMGELLRFGDEILEREDLETFIKEDISPLFDDPRARRFIRNMEGRQLAELLKEAKMICLRGLDRETEE